MRIELETRLPCPPAEAWRHLRTSALLRHVAAPLLAFEPIDPAALPDVWEPGRYRVRMRALGVLPLGRQWIGIEMPAAAPDPATGRYAIRDDGRGDLVARWDHRIVLEPDGAGGSRYVDRVELEAGWLTPLVWLFAQLFYRHRQRRWRALARSGFAPLRAARA